MSIIRKRRVDLGLTQSQLAAAVGVTVGAIHSWEHGLRRPSARRAALLYRVLELDAEEIAALYLEEKP